MPKPFHFFFNPSKNSIGLINATKEEPIKIHLKYDQNIYADDPRLEIDNIPAQVALKILGHCSNQMERRMR